MPQVIPVGIALLVLAACAAEPPAAAPNPQGPVSAGVEERLPPEPPGQGFVVWESNRTGAWRLWIRDLDGSPPRQLTADEGDRQHCCPHISPDGQRLAYLSLPRGATNYPESGASGPMHLLDLGSETESAARKIAEEARTYFEHRAAVWRSASELIYIDGDGITHQLDVDSGASQPLIERGEERHGWLINSQLTHATTGRPSFSTYDSGGRRIQPARVLGGCQPYFSYDGRWGFWVAGAGGPIRAFELSSGRTLEVLAKSDPRLPADQGYLYFPNLSHDSTMIAVAASPDQHEHETSNYDVFVAAVDPDTLEVLGDAWQATTDPGSDRFPDVYARLLALGRHFGEAPLTVPFSASGDDWRWTFGDGTADATGGQVEHTFEPAGGYTVEATRGQEVLRGFVRVRPAAPPRVDSVSVRRDAAGGAPIVVIRFDEPVDLKAVRATFDSGLSVEGLEPGTDSRSLNLQLAEELTTFETLKLDGVRDRAQQANTMATVALEIDPPAWPVDPRGLLFLWQSDDALNEVQDPATGEPRVSQLTPQGRAWLDRHYGMELAGGLFFADDASVLGVLNGAQRTNELTLEATLTPRDGSTAEMARIVSFSSNLRSRNLTLGQQGDRLVWRLRTATTGQNAGKPQLDLGPLIAGRPTHVLVTYTPGRMVAWLNGEKTLDTDVVQDGFFHWRARPLVFGNEWQAERPWHGTLEAVAIYDRALGEDEALESYRRATRRLAERPEVETIRLRATLTARSPTPSLEEITPYRHALAAYEYRVDEVLAGAYEKATIRTVHRVLADGEVLPVSRRAEGGTYELTVESFYDHPQLESLYLSNTLPERPELPLFFSSAIEP